MIYIIGYFVLGFISASLGVKLLPKYNPSMLFVFLWIFWLPTLCMGIFFILMELWIKKLQGK
jgi:hypothetical protein